METFILNKIFNAFLNFPSNFTFSFSYIAIVGNIDGAKNQLPKSIPTFKITPTSSTEDKPKSFPTGGFDLASSGLTGITSAKTPVTSTSSDDIKTPKKVTFVIPSLNTASSSTTTSTNSAGTSGGFSFKTPSLPISSGVPASSSTTTSSFSFAPKDSAAPTITPNLSVANTSAEPALSFNLSSANTIQQPASSSGFSFGSQVSATTATPSAPPPSFTQATAPSSNALPQFSFNPKPAATNTVASVTPNIAPSLSTSSVANLFGATASTSTSSNLFAKPAATNLFNSAVASAATSFGGAQPPASTQASNLFGATSVATANQPAAPSFNFGVKTATPATTAPATSQPSFMTSTNPGGFSFNQSTSTVASTNSGFSFGAPNKPAVSVTTSAISSSASVFGAPSSASVFGAPSAVTNNVFANPSSSQSVFNTAPASSTAASLFGAKPTAPPATSQPGFSFGVSNPSTASSGFSFGAKPAISTAPKPSSGFSFGISKTQAPSNNTASVFGHNPAASNTAASVFGQPAAAQSTASSVFGKPAATGVTPFGQTPSTASVFGQPASGASVFGLTNNSNNAASSVFGAPTNNNTNSVFGKASTAVPTPFGQAANNNKVAGSVFGAPTSTTGTVNPFGQPQQQNSSAGFSFGGNAQPSFNFGGSGGKMNYSVFNLSIPDSTFPSFTNVFYTFLVIWLSFTSSSRGETVWLGSFTYFMNRMFFILHITDILTDF